MRKKVTVVGPEMSAPVARPPGREGSGRHCRGGYSRRYPQGKALDILQACPVEGIDVQLTGANDYAPRPTPTSSCSPPASPEARHEPRDLLWANYDIVRPAVEQAVKHSPDAI